MPPPPAHPVIALILAGGAGARHGGAIKANLPLSGTRFLDHVRARLDPALPVLLSIGPHAAELFAPLGGLMPLPDAAPGLGPLTGIRAAAETPLATGAQWLLTVAVDAPLVPRDLLPRLLSAAGGAAAAVATHQGQWHPTHALYRLDALRPALAHLPAGVGPRALLDSLGAIPVAFAEEQGLDPFTSANTPEALKRLEDAVFSGEPRSAPEV